VNTEATTPCPLVGVEWVVEAFDCDQDRLRDPDRLRAACGRLLADLGLHPLGDPLWHQFPFPGGVTGLYLLTESHLACHTYPEHALATFNLYCCRPRPRWPWEDRLGGLLGAKRVLVRSLSRGEERPNPPAPFPLREGGDGPPEGRS
jgi:S-adenosylmethionine decarboxylase